MTAPISGVVEVPEPLGEGLETRWGDRGPEHRSWTGVSTPRPWRPSHLDQRSRPRFGAYARGVAAPTPLETERPVLPRLLREPTLPVLLMALVAMVRRQYVPDICLVAGTAALVVVDARRWRLRTASAQPVGRTVGPGVLGITATLAAAIAVLPGGTGGVLDIAFAVVGVLLIRQVWSPGREPAAGDATALDPPRRWWCWPLVGVMLALIELFSFVHQSAPMVDNPQHPTLSSVVEPHLTAWPVRALVLWAWLLGCWWLVRRLQAWRPR